MSPKNKIEMGSNRNFGIVFFVVLSIFGLWPTINEGEIRISLLILALLFLVLGLVNSKILTPLNKLWFKFGMILNIIIPPVVMGIVFFLVVTPIGVIMNIMGKDLLNKKFDKKKKTYWIKRDKLVGTMRKQF